MSKEAVSNFYKAVAQDQALQDKLKAADRPSSVVNMAAELGYEFTEEELVALMQERKDSGELDESQMDAVAGGMRDNCYAGSQCYIGDRMTY